MPITLLPNEQIRLTSTLVDYNPDTGEEEPVDPSNVSGQIYKWNGSAYVADGAPFVPTEQVDLPGSFYYDWTPTSTGKYRIDFIAVVNIDVTITDSRIFYVGTITTTSTLGPYEDTYFLSELEPLYVNPEEITNYYYPEGDPVEVAQLIHRYSLQVEKFLDEDPLTEVTAEVHDYILAATMCDLSRIYYFEGGIGGFSKSDSFRLGDLSVENSSGSSSSANNDSVGSASSWCEIAALLKNNLQFRAVSMRSFVKASAWENPVRNRVNESKFIKRRG